MSRGKARTINSTPTSTTEGFDPTITRGHHFDVMTVQVRATKAKPASKNREVYVVSEPATLAEYTRTYGIKRTRMTKALARAKKELCAR